jgi:hypothetical protein
MVCDGTLCVIDPESTWNLYVDGYDIGAPYDGVPYDSDGPPDLDIAVHSETNGHVIGQLAGPEDTASGEFTPASGPTYFEVIMWIRAA